MLRAKSPEKPKAACARWRAKNPEVVRTYSHTYYATNREQEKAASAEWRAANPDKIKAYTFNNREKAKTQRTAQRDYNYAMLTQKFGSACLDCNSILPMGVYHYHHTTPHTKNETWLSAYGWQWPRVDAYTNGTVQLCPTCHFLRHRRERPQTTNDRRDTNYANLAKKFGAECGDCRQVFPMGVYHYHHLDPSTKDRKLRIEGWKWVRVDAYTNGTTQLCPTCHFLRHHHEKNRRAA